MCSRRAFLTFPEASWRDMLSIEICASTDQTWNFSVVVDTDVGVEMEL